MTEINTEKKVLQFPGQKPRHKIRLKHILEVFHGFSKGDVDTGARAVHHLNVAQMRNTRDIISQSLREVGRESEIFITTTDEIDPHVYDHTVGMTQSSPDGGTFVATDVVTNTSGERSLISLAFTTQLRDEIRTILGKPQEQKKLKPAA